MRLFRQPEPENCRFPVQQILAGLKVVAGRRHA